MKSTVEEIRARFDADVDRFSNLDSGQSATVDAPLVLDLVARAAAAADPRASRLLDVGCGAGNYTLKLLEHLPLRRIDLAVDRLTLMGGSFPDTRIRAAPAAGGTALGFEGPALAGSLQLPDGAGPVIGRFERVHWQRTPAIAGAAAPARNDAPPADDSSDPARLPALQIDVADGASGSHLVAFSGVT